MKITFIDSTTLLLSWSKPIQPNGIITNYSINCSSDDSIYYTDSSVVETGLISGLQPYTNYTCSVSAYTKVGKGPAVTNTGVTDQSSEFILYRY